MTSAAKRILDEALALPEDERAELALALRDSLTEHPVSLSSEWTAEVGNRIRELEDGSVKAVPWSELEARVNESLGRD